MVSADTARNIVGIIGNVISFGLFISPWPTFYKIIKNRDVEGFKPDPYLATVLNCSMWVFYGMPFVHPDSILVITINGVGFILEMIYLGIFVTYANAKGRKRVAVVLIGEAIFMVIVIVGTLLGAHGHTRRSMIVGILCVIFNVCMYASPLTVMGKVIKTKSVKYMPFWLSFTNCVNGMIWTAYALIKLDVYMLISNGLGAISGVVQLVLYACYYSSTPRDDDDGSKGEQTGVQLSTSHGEFRV